MQQLKEVGAAKALMIEAHEWSVMKWLREKKTVRKMADRANAALDAQHASVKAKWSQDLRLAYDLSASDGSNPQSPKHDPGISAFAKRVRLTDDTARKAREDAEKTFDDAEKQLSTTLAREGCRKAIASWELHEKAITLAEKGISMARK